MKRFLFLFLILGFLMTGCSSLNKPSNLSSVSYKIGIKVLDTTDDYLDQKITAVVAAGQIQDLCRDLSAVPDETGSKDQEVKNYCEVLSYTLMLVADGDHINEKEIIHTRNTLATLLGKDIKS